MLFSILLSHAFFPYQEVGEEAILLTKVLTVP